MDIATIRKLIDAGLDDDTIQTVIDATDNPPAANTPQAPPAIGNRATPAANGRRKPGPKPRQTEAAATEVAPGFVKPNQTSVSYRATPLGNTPAKLDKLGVSGNKRAVMDLVLSANGNGVDSRQMRATILQHKLRADGTNKAIESAVHGLKVDGLLRAADKPQAPGNGITGTGVKLG